MRPLAILSVALVLLVGLALTPTASAAAIEIPPIVCGPDAMCTEPELGICDSPDMCNDAGCPYPVGAEGGTSIKLGDYTITNECGPQSLCSGPMRCTSPFEDGLASSTAVMIPPVCIWKEAAVGPVTAGVDQCRESHETSPCYSPQRIHIYRQAGPVYAQVHFCFPHSPPPDLTTAAPPSPCGGGMTTSAADEPTQRCPAPYPIRPCDAAVSPPVALAAAEPIIDLPEPRPEFHVEVSPECHVDLFVKWDIMNCLFGEQYNPTQVGPLVTVWIWGCAPPPPPPEWMALEMAPPCTCPPPRPLCYDVNRAVAWNDDLWMDDSCNVTVDVEANCGLQGYDQHEEHIGKVTLRYQTCQQPPQE